MLAYLQDLAQGGFQQECQAVRGMQHPETLLDLRDSKDIKLRWCGEGRGV